MKIMATFFGNNNVLNKTKNIKDIVSSKDVKTKNESFFNKILNNLSIYLYIIFGIIGISFFASYINISPKVLNFATNFRQAEEKEFEIADVLKIYSIYNKDNYIIAENKEVEKAEVIENPLQSEIDIIDNEAKENIEEVFGNTKNEAVITKENDSLQRVTLGTTNILNYSSKRDFDFSSLGNTNITLTKKTDKILLYNTHTSETYTNSENYKFEYTGTMRTTDAKYNMLAIANELKENLNSKGFLCTHDTTPHDYGTYTSSYARSKITVQNALASMGGASISIDVHRDAVADLTYAPTVDIKGVKVAQLMFVMGVGSDTTKNPYAEENLKLALKIQQIADKVYPGLFKAMIIRDSVYNQDLNKYSFLVEVGATGNTIEEAKLATRCLANLLNIVYKD